MSNSNLGTIEIKLVRDATKPDDPRRFLRNAAWPSVAPMPKYGDLITLEILVNGKWVDQPWVVVGIDYLVHAIDDYSPAKVSFVYTMREIT